MRLPFVLITGLVLVGLTSGLRVEIGDEKVGVFYFDGSNEDYAQVAMGDSDDNVSDIDIEDTIYTGWSYGSRGRMVSLGTWIKPENNTAGLNKIIEFKLVHHYELVMEASQLKLMVVEQSGSHKVFNFPNCNVTMNEWHFILLTVYPQPSMYTKGLNKSPLRELASEVMEQEDLEQESSGTNTWAIGRGFKGKITPVLIRRHYSTSSFNRYKTCLTSHDPFSLQCNSNENSILRGSNLVSSYKLIPNSNVKLEPYTEISISFATDIQCSDLDMSLSIMPTAFNLPTPTTKSYYDRYHYNRVRYVDYPVNVTLGESGCNLTWSGESTGYQATNASLASCGFKSRTDGEQTIYMNSVYSHTHSETKKLMDVSCRYTPRPMKIEEVTVSAYVIDKISLESTHTFTPWSFSLHLYSDSSFTEELDMPLKIENAGENIFAEAKVEAIEKGAVLEIESCRTHITLNELDELQKTLIKNYKIVSLSAEFLKTDEATRKRFSFKADKFEDYPKAMVYLSCVLSVRQGDVAVSTQNGTEALVTENGKTPEKDAKKEAISTTTPNFVSTSSSARKRV